MPVFTLPVKTFAEYEIKKSKFIAHLSPVSSKKEAVIFIEEVKKKYENARHNVPCYIVGENFEEKWFSDDGEPKGSSGLPIMSILLKMKITNIAVVVTRYFGGIKLGVGGLARAYSKTVSLALEKVELKPFVKYATKKEEINYSEFEAFKKMLAEKNGEILEQNFGDKISLTIKIPII
jgi:uncharacterized YigZ family protein